MLTIEEAQNVIADELKKLQIPKEPWNLYEPVRYILRNGGKRIRPALVLLACDLFGQDYRKALYPAIGIEVFHNFTLLHDDLMDNSIVRRNSPTVHIKWDANTAILSGDAMSILANSLISKVDPVALVPVNRLFNKTALEVCEGQMLDMEYSTRQDVTISQYINMIRLKTSVLIAASLGLGALIAGSGEEESEVIYNFGLNLGIAFQLKDDLLDSFGEQEVFGKKIGNDILTNKRTFLLIKAFEKAGEEDRAELKKYFPGEEINPEKKIQGVLQIFDKLGIRKETENEIASYYNKALGFLKVLKIDEHGKKGLEDFANTLINREK